MFFLNFWKHSYVNTFCCGRVTGGSVTLHFFWYNTLYGLEQGGY